MGPSDNNNVGRPSRSGRIPFGVILLGVCALVLAAAVPLFYFVTPDLIAGPEQPVSFSHHLHASVKQIDCRFCHHLVDRSAYPGLPAVEKCLYCHKVIITEHPEIVKLRRYYESNTPVPWRKVTYLPDHVHFSHRQHMAASIDCTACHGDVAAMDRVVQVIPFRMGFCIGCHKEKKAPVDCARCHY